MATVAHDHTTSQTGVKWSSFGPQATLLISLVTLKESVLVLKGWQKAICKKQTWLSTAILSKCLDSTCNKR